MILSFFNYMESMVCSQAGIEIFLKNVHRWAYLAFKQNKSLLARYSTLGSLEVITNVIQQRYK